jgi:hypothetical protein
LAGASPALLRANPKKFAVEQKKLASERNKLAAEAKRVPAAEKKLAAHLRLIEGPQAKAVDALSASGKLIVEPKAVRARVVHHHPRG